MKNHSRILLGILFLAILSSCTEYVPKPRGYVRIEPEAPDYQLLSDKNLPFQFHISQWVTIESPGVQEGDWIHLAYPSLGAKVYCTYLSITPESFEEIEQENRSLVARHARLEPIREKEYTNAEYKVYGSLFLLGGDSPSPIQFMLTDSVSRFFRGSLFFDAKPNADSLAPAIHYIQEDIIELIQSFHWSDSYASIP
ncbi:gliding motility protein GldD [Parabacteroides sp. 52]|uniref:gliding motility lipoprotein GldD n=1 Tax=unclassified Parabacteroides TaxID=2649774 RepID=UPI0013D7076F|nr:MULTISPECIES: gliding motility protein GldD [unclassified Parabacteroides]MDH6535566.1 gliding motility-associated lipoprotein GldD [Parabacteroides sp. PM5-20]NDV56045.1 gliding motility protein GldD [Parabacteroides sp. 52]